MKLGSSAGRTKPAPSLSAPDRTHPDGGTQGERGGDKNKQQPRRGQSAESIQKSVIPRTRDDSSDEDEPIPMSRPQGAPLLDTNPPLLGNAPPPVPGYPGVYPGGGYHFSPRQPLLLQQPPPPHHMMQPPRTGGLVPLPPQPVVGNMGGPGLLPHHMPPPAMVSVA